MKVIEFCCLSTIFAVIAFVSGVNATPLSRYVMRDALPASAPELIDEQPEMAPIAFLRFCNMNEAQCRGDFTQSRLNLTIETWRLLHSVTLRSTPVSYRTPAREPTIGRPMRRPAIATTTQFKNRKRF